MIHAPRDLDEKSLSRVIYTDAALAHTYCVCSSHETIISTRRKLRTPTTYVRTVVSISPIGRETQPLRSPRHGRDTAWV